MTGLFLTMMRRLAAEEALLSLVTACGGGGSGGLPPVTMIPPTVTGVTTDNGVGGVFLNSRVAVTFDQAIDPPSVTATTVTLTAGGSTVAGSSSVNGSTAVFRPSTPLAPATTYQLTVTTGVRSTSGAHLATQFTRSFTTGTATDTAAPVVRATSPANNETVINASSIAFIFNEPVDITTVTDLTFFLADGSTTVSGSFT